MAQGRMTYREAVDSVTGEVKYEDWRENLRQGKAEVASVLLAARNSGDLRFYNVRGEDGSITPMVAPRQSEQTSAQGTAGVKE